MGGTVALQSFGNFQANTRAMPLLRSLAEDLARVPIDMALLTELLHCRHRFHVKNPCKVKPSSAALPFHSTTDFKPTRRGGHRQVFLSLELGAWNLELSPLRLRQQRLFLRQQPRVLRDLQVFRRLVGLSRC